MTKNKGKQLQNSQRKKLKDIVREMGIQDAGELYEALRDIFSDTLEEMLQSELDEHLGYEKYKHGEKPTNNRRNGCSTKTVISQAGQLELKLPRDREGSFEPQVVKKGQKDISQIEEKILSMYAKGMSDRDISATVEDIYGFSVSHDTISRIVDRIQPRLSEWQSRPLEAVYAFVYVDAMIVKVKQDGKACNKAVYTVIGIDMDGHKDILGFWIAEKEGAHFWMLVFDELRARGVQGIRFVCIDGLPGLEEGIATIFPTARIQRCMVHLVQNSLKYIPSKHYKAFWRFTARRPCPKPETPWNGFTAGILIIPPLYGFGRTISNLLSACSISHLKSVGWSTPPIWWRAFIPHCAKSPEANLRSQTIWPFSKCYS